MPPSNRTSTCHYRWVFLAGTFLALVMGFLLFLGFEGFLQSLPQEGALLSVSAEDTPSTQDALFYPAPTASTLEAPMSQRGPLGDDTNNDGQDDGVADHLVGLAPTRFHMPQRGALDNDTDNDGQDDSVADSFVGLSLALLLIPFLVSAFLAPLYELPKKSQGYFPILERPG